jgi:PAS domain-containing protein
MLRGVFRSILRGASMGKDETEDSERLQQPDAGQGPEEGPGFHVVGVGASAGGLTALQELSSALPAQPGIASIVIQYLAPTHSSHTADILARSADIPIILVDTQLRLKRMPEPASRVINVKPSDLGRPLTDITHQFADADPAEAARNVLAGLVKAEKDVVSRDGRCYLIRAVPYRTADDRIDGVTGTGFDVGQVERAEHEGFGLFGIRERIQAVGGGRRTSRALRAKARACASNCPCWPATSSTRRQPLTVRRRTANGRPKRPHRCSFSSPTTTR